MSLTNFLSNHTGLVGLLLIGGFVLWKFVIQPIQNEGKELDPTEEQIEGFKFDPGEHISSEVDF